MANSLYLQHGGDNINVMGTTSDITLFRMVNILGWPTGWPSFVFNVNKDGWGWCYFKVSWRYGWGRYWWLSWSTFWGESAYSDSDAQCHTTFWRCEDSPTRTGRQRWCCLHCCRSTEGGLGNMRKFRMRNAESNMRNDAAELLYS